MKENNFLPEKSNFPFKISTCLFFPLYLTTCFTVMIAHPDALRLAWCLMADLAEGSSGRQTEVQRATEFNVGVEKL